MIKTNKNNLNPTPYNFRKSNKIEIQQKNKINYSNKIRVLAKPEHTRLNPNFDYKTHHKTSFISKKQFDPCLNFTQKKAESEKKSKL